MRGNLTTAFEKFPDVCMEPTATERGPRSRNRAVKARQQPAPEASGAAHRRDLEGQEGSMDAPGRGKTPHRPSLNTSSGDRKRC